MASGPRATRGGVVARLLRRDRPARGGADHDVAYGPDPEQELELYHPAMPGPAHLVAFLHGGGWMTGGRKGARKHIAPPLNRAGYAVASIGYRLFPRTDVAGQLSDAASAIAFLLKDAARFGIDPASFSLMGHSSGAHLAAMLATDSSYLQRAGVDPAKLHAVIALDGVFDIKASLTHYPNKTHGVFGDDPSKWPALSPIDQVARMISHPKFVLIHEDTNPRFVEQEALFEAELKKQGEAVEEVTAPGLTHNQVAKDFADPAQPMVQAALDALEEP